MVQGGTKRLRSRPEISNLNQVHTDRKEPSGDEIELKFRRAHILGKLGEKDNAISSFKEVLLHWEKKNDFHQQARIWRELLDLVFVTK